MPENTASTPAVEPKVKKPRLIRKTVFAKFATMTPDEIKAYAVADFKALVLSVEPEWKMADDDKRVLAHLSWYRSAYLKEHAPAAEEAPTEASVAA